MAASRRGHFDIVDQLLLHGADPDMKDDVSLSCTHVHNIVLDYNDQFHMKLSLHMYVYI